MREYSLGLGNKLRRDWARSTGQRRSHPSKPVNAVGEVSRIGSSQGLVGVAARRNSVLPQSQLLGEVGHLVAKRFPKSQVSEVLSELDSDSLDSLH